MGFLVSQRGHLGAIPPPPLLSVPPRRACEVEVRYPPHKRGISAILARYPLKTRQNACDTPLRYYLERVLRDVGGYLALGRWVGDSHSVLWWYSFSLPLSWPLSNNQKSPRAHKNKIGTSPPPPKPKIPPPPLKRGILWTRRFSCRKNAEILGAHKISAAISGPRIADTNSMDTRIFLK